MARLIASDDKKMEMQPRLTLILEQLIADAILRKVDLRAKLCMVYHHLLPVDFIYGYEMILLCRSKVYSCIDIYGESYSSVVSCIVVTL